MFSVQVTDLRFQCSVFSVQGEGFRFEGSVFSAAVGLKLMTGLTREETDERPTSNIQHPTSNNVFYRFINENHAANVAPANIPLRIRPK